MLDNPVAKILCIGEEWTGSNASGLFHALSRVGCLTNIVNELKYISVKAKFIPTKIFNRAIRPLQVDDFNRQVQAISRSFSPDIVLVYKGAFLKPELIRFWKERDVPVVNFFPDITFFAYGKLLPSCVPLYDHIFTTKTFVASDLARNFGYDERKVTFIPHGFDPLVHRPINGFEDKMLECDASFIGSYSPHKEEYLATLKTKMPRINFKIWGSGWHRVRTTILKDSIQGVTVTGDLYALALKSSKINIALLQEKLPGATTGDQITSRTFHIPASHGFMLHQRTMEVQEYFKEGEEIACFDTPEELADKVDMYLAKVEEREKIKEKGFQRVVRDHSLDRRAIKVLQVLRNRGLI